MTITAPGMNLVDFAKRLYIVLDRPVIDKTGIKGRFDIHLEFAAPETEFVLLLRVETTDAPAGPSIFTAVQQQLGLKLESSRGAREFLVIDHVERPT
jgi:uncharacterized protein (TIGR03435 family)